MNTRARGCRIFGGHRGPSEITTTRPLPESGGSVERFRFRSRTFENDVYIYYAHRVSGPKEIVYFRVDGRRPRVGSPAKTRASPGAGSTSGTARGRRSRPRLSGSDPEIVRLRLYSSAPSRTPPPHPQRRPNHASRRVQVVRAPVVSKILPPTN